MNRHKSGQILILVLLVVVVALAVGLSVASRNLTSLKTSTQAEQSQRAFSAAEGGVEDVISRLNSVASVMNTGTATNCSKVDSSNASCSLPNATVGVSGNVKVTAQTSYEKVVDLGDVAQVNLRGFSGSFTVSWIKSGDPADNSLEFFFVCTNDATTSCPVTVGGTLQSTPKSAGSYGQHRVAYTSNTSISGQTGFTQCAAGTSPYTCALTFSVSGNVELLRIKPFHNRTTLSIAGSGLPVQTYQITSTATTETGLSRKVQVTRDALPQLPAVFDYVLYSGQDIIK